jgi:6-phosphofructokinase 1
MTKIAILTSGGDAPGMNAAIRAVVRSALVEGFETYVVYDGYKGLYEGKIKQVERYFVSEIINRGGTIIGTARLPQFVNLDVQETSANNLKKFGIKCVCLPGTIDNDLSSTDFTIGFDTALNTIIEAVDKLRDTSSSHQRCSIIEVMGRNCGDLALYSGIAAGAELILSSERVMTKEMILSELIQAKSEGQRHEIVIVSEKLFDVNKLAEEIEQKVGMEARATILGHLQRGGKPSAFDRVLASRMGSRAVEAFESCYSSCCIGIKNNQVVVMDLETSLKMPRMVDLRLYTDSERLK